MRDVRMIGKTISHYRILEKLGEGGMGVVYEAQDTKLDRTVALKFLPPELMRDADAKSRLIHEAKAAATLSHPNICTVFEVDDTLGQSFIAMEYVEGESLRDKINSGPLRLRDALSIATQVAEGLLKAHEKGIVHRDIKSANIMVTKDGQVKIMDFGLAKSARGTKLTREGTTLGTVAYMSPEQARGAEADRRTDIWSLGVVIYEMLTGQLPFKGDYEQAVMYAILNQSPEPVTGLRSGIPIELERIIDKAMAKRPEERYQHIDELLVDLRSVTSGARSPRRTRKTAKPRQTARRIVLLAAGFVALIVLAVFVGQKLLVKPTGAIDSIAVLPLENLSGDPGQEYFADGMTEALITELSKIKALRVISRTSVMQYKEARKPLPEIARELNVKAVVEGSALRAGNRIRVTAQVIEAKSDRHLWAESYDRSLEDVLTLQKELARTIAQEIRVHVTPQEKARLSQTRAVDPDAYEAYVKGRYFWNQRTGESLRKSLVHFRTAIQKDSTYALGYAGLADAYALLGFNGYMPVRETVPQARAAARRALELDDSVAEAHATVALIQWLYDWDLGSAEAEFREAIVLDPGCLTARYWLAYLLAYRGRFDEAIGLIHESEQLDPLSLMVMTVGGIVHFYAGDYDKAMEEALKIRALDPRYPTSYWLEGWVLLHRDEYREAITAFNKAAELGGMGGGYKPGLVGYAYARAGMEAEARALLDSLVALAGRGLASPMGVVQVYAGLGEKEAAFRWLNRAYEERDPELIDLQVDPIYSSLRSDLRFGRLLEKMGLEPR